MSELDDVIDTGVKAMNDSLDILDRYFNCVSPITRMIMMTIVKTTAQMAYELDRADSDC